MNPTRSSPHRTLHRILRRAWATTRGLRCSQGSRFLSLPPSHLAPAPTNPTGPRPLFRTRTPVLQEASVMDFIRLISVGLHRSLPRAKGIQRQPIMFRSPRSRISTPLPTPIPPLARAPPSNQKHHPLCTIPRNTTIRLSRTFSRIRRYPRYQVLLRVTPPPSSTIAAINF